MPRALVHQLATLLAVGIACGASVAGCAARSRQPGVASFDIPDMSSRQAVSATDLAVLGSLGTSRRDRDPFLSMSEEAADKRRAAFAKAASERPPPPPG